jgi:hypothetical protein
MGQDYLAAFEKITALIERLDEHAHAKAEKTA